VRNLAVLRPLIAEILLERDTADWIARLEAAGVPCGPINTVPQVFEEDQVRHRGMLADIGHPLAGTVPQVVSPMRFTDAPLAFERAPPLLGEHTAEILRELGIEDARQGAA
jgi:crotonobetainyl-CoA:carnitine CoA-transferase CaiB-like acyl-CoA transferase